MHYTGVRNDKGESPLDHALECMNEGCVDVSLYLLSPGYGGDKEKIKLLNGACEWGELNVVKDLIEQQKVDPSKCQLTVDHFINVMSTPLFRTTNMLTKIIP